MSLPACHITEKGTGSKSIIKTNNLFAIQFQMLCFQIKLATTEFKNAMISERFIQIYNGTAGTRFTPILVLQKGVSIQCNLLFSLRHLTFE